jgi:HAE1 family hydrophobic/amphiphilic exporter-1
VADALRSANSNSPTGALWGPNRTYTVETDGALLQAEGYRSSSSPTATASRFAWTRSPHVVDGVENDKTAAVVQQRPGIILAHPAQPGTNTVEVAKAVRDLSPAFEAEAARRRQAAGHVRPVAEP